MSKIILNNYKMKIDKDVKYIKKNDYSLDENITKMVDNLLNEDEPANMDQTGSSIKSLGVPVILINGMAFGEGASTHLNDNYQVNRGSKNKLGLNFNSNCMENINDKKIHKTKKNTNMVNGNRLDDLHSGSNLKINRMNLSNFENVNNLNNNNKIGILNKNVGKMGSSGRLISPKNSLLNNNLNQNNFNFKINQNLQQMTINNTNFSNTLINNHQAYQPIPNAHVQLHEALVPNFHLDDVDINNIKHNIPVKSRPKRYQDAGNVDLDEILETRVKVVERVDEESLLYLRGNFNKLIISQNGSRILQRALKKTNSNILTIIFEEIKYFLPDLMNDLYANYFCQRFYDFLTFFQKIEFLNMLKDHFVTIGQSAIGTYPLQAIIDQMKTKDERWIIIEALRENILEMCQHAQGTHIIEKIILCFEEESIKEIYQIIYNNFMSLACHSNGLCVTKKVISCSRNPIYLENIQRLLIENGKTLVQNQHGNYSIQVALETWEFRLIQPLIILFHDQFYFLSTQKYSSNVVEKCLERGGEAVLSKFLEEICHKTKIVELIKSPYGNYVIQKALKLASGYHKGRLTGIIKKHLEKLNDKKLISKWKVILGNICGNSLTLNGFRHNINNMMNTSNDSNFSSGSLSNSRDGYSPPSDRLNGSNMSYSSVHSSHSYNPPSMNFMHNMQMNINPITNTNNQFFVPNVQRSFKSENYSPDNSSAAYSIFI